MKVTILGSTGMLGHQMVNVLRGHDRTMYNSQHFDLSKLSQIHDLCDTLKPDDLVVNCCGMIRQRLPKIPSPDDMQATFMLNSVLPFAISERCHLIHISSDCVFSGNLGGYRENHLPDSEDIYGRTKAMGEPIDALVLRTSIIGPEIRKEKLGLFEWFMGQKEAKGFTNHYWNGLTTLELSACVSNIIDSGKWEQKGLYHLFSDSVSKYELLCEMNGYRSDSMKVIIEPVTAGSTVDRTLQTNHTSFLNALNINSLSDQLRYMFLRPGV